jgi:uncharacterized membrane protein YdbT with pleckstrin-like domain
LVILVLKPSLWFIPLQSLFFSSVVIFVAICAAQGGIVAPRSRFFDAAGFVIAARLTWAAMHWMGRLYVLTDQRLLRLSGVFSTDVFDCPLRKVATVRLTATMRERVLRLGTIDILPSDERRAPASWQTLDRPRQVHAEILAALTRAKS